MPLRPFHRTMTTLGRVLSVDIQGKASTLSSEAETAAQVNAQWSVSRACASKAGELRVLYPSLSLIHI